ncbi:MFS transporter [Planotetraspora sp. A-T 1434]|uniref:MFS transporter n=1 Tax=Planotetraspora sp. A-T 1434 TaxID=2979219 RepID=UPI0021C1BA63|nr:MFS transporter [Planotetraspora sp. A-T 1434]MCT9930195.1 MFS transporter [Planotetraspora sp. A-T 1434]
MPPVSPAASPTVSPAVSPAVSLAAGPPDSRRARASHRTGFWFAAVAFTAQMGFGTAPTPLWPLYGARDGFGPTTGTVAFALLVVGAAASFLGLGHLSDRHGRRRVIVPALLTAILAALVLIAWPDLPGLLAGRLLTGVGVGLMASTATTYLSDLYGRANPREEGRPVSPVPGIVATAANLGGLALGPLVAGIIAQWAPQPLVLTQVAFAAAMAVSLVLVLASPETVDAGARNLARPARFLVRPGGGGVFAAAGGLGFAVFAGFALVASLGAVMIRGRLGITSPFVSGFAGFLMFGAAAAAQISMGRAPTRRILAAGTALFPLGLALIAVSLSHPALWLYLVSTAVTGAGGGLLFKGGVGHASWVAVPASRAGVLAVFFVVAYVGMGLPVILFSVVADHVGLQPTLIGFAALLSAGAALCVVTVRRGARD